MSDKCPTNLICTCYVGDDQNECQDMPCYACVLEGKKKAEAELAEAKVKLEKCVYFDKDDDIIQYVPRKKDGDVT